jgi:hypothetical protein
MKKYVDMNFNNTIHQTIIFIHASTTVDTQLLTCDILYGKYPTSTCFPSNRIILSFEVRFRIASSAYPPRKRTDLTLVGGEMSFHHMLYLFPNHITSDYHNDMTFPSCAIITNYGPNCHTLNFPNLEIHPRI